MALILVSCNAGAAAALRSVSYSEWRIDQGRVSVRIEFPAIQAARLVGKRYALLSTENVGGYVLERIGVSAGGVACAATDQGYDLGKVNALSLGSDLYGFEIVFQCIGAGPFRLRNTVFMDDQPAHCDYAQIEAAGRRVPQLFTAAHSSIDVTPAHAAGGATVRFVPLGARHTAGSLSRSGALLALLLLAASRRILLLAALAAGYLLSWILAFSGLQPEVAYLEAAIGFVSVTVAALLLVPGPPRKPHWRALCSVALLATGMAVLRQAQAGVLIAGLSLLGGMLVYVAHRGREVPVATLGVLFGLIDGFVLPGDFARLKLDRVDAPLLAAFDLGSFLCAALLLIVGWAVARLFERSRISWPRLATRDLATALLSGLGIFWMLSPL